MKFVTKGFVMSAAVWATACSGVHFQDASNGSLSANSAEMHQDSFDFNDSNSKSKVDILIIDDNSGSMLDRQQKMAANMGPFVATLGNVDWQIGITTTDTSTGPYGIQGSFVPLNGGTGNILRPSMANYETIFDNTIVRQEILTCGTGPCPSDDERPLLAIDEAIAKRNTDNAGFFRSDASLAVIVLSDEDESYAADGNPVAPQTVINTVHAALGPNKTFNTYGIITKPDDAACIATNATLLGGIQHPSVFIAQLIQMTGGVAGSVCDSDYVSSLTAIGQSVNQNSATRTLSLMPQSGSVDVKILPPDPSLTYTIVGQQIKFNKMPAQGTQVIVSYLPM